MSRKQKRLQKVRQNPKNVTFDELRRVLEDFQFEMRPSQGTSHHFFRAEIKRRVWSMTIPFKRPHLNVVYVKKALFMLDEIIDWREQHGFSDLEDDEE